MLKPMLILLIAITLLGGCKSKTEKGAEATAAESATPPAAASTASAETPANPSMAASTAPPATAPTAAPETPGNPTEAESTPPQPSAPPIFDVGLSVEQAYAAIPHRRTVWVETDSPVPAEARAYLRVIFRVMDQAVAVRVAGLQNFSAQQFDNSDPAANYGRLIGFVRGMPVPSELETYHQKILEALAGQQQFFADWKSERDQFRFAQQIGGHEGVRNASAALHAAYEELMAKYPDESAANKDAFFDYHCALDFL